MTEMPENKTPQAMTPPIDAPTDPVKTAAESPIEPPLDTPTPAPAATRATDQTPTPSSAPQQAFFQLLQKGWVNARPTLLQLAQGLTQVLNRLATQLEAQEQQAQRQGSAPAKPIDWTPAQRLGSSFWRTTQPLWQTSLAALRPRLPQDLQALSDRTLSGILAGTLLLILWIFSWIPSGQVTPPPVTPSRAPRTPYTQSDPLRSRSVPAAPTAIGSSDRFIDRSVPQPIPDRLSSPARSPITRSAPTPPAPVTSAPLPSDSRPTPDREAEPLSPDAQKRAKLRQDLDIIASTLLDNAIVGIRPQFATQALTITLSDGWYNLSDTLQDKLANGLLVIAQGKDFKQLQLEATDGTVLSRSPVVGEGMLVLHRQP